MARRHHTADIYTDCFGRTCAASQTDQAGKRGIGTVGRSYNGNPVEWYGDNNSAATIHGDQQKTKAMAAALLRWAADWPAAVQPIVDEVAANTRDKDAWLILADWMEEFDQNEERLAFDGSNKIANLIRGSVRKIEAEREDRRKKVTSC